MRVLIVEADLATRLALRKLFRKAGGWDVDEADKAARALMLLDRAPDWIVLDLTSPGLHGSLILWEVRARKFPVRVAALAGASERGRIESVGPLEPDLVIARPIDGLALLAAIGRDNSNERDDCDVSGKMDFLRPQVVEGRRLRPVEVDPVAAIGPIYDGRQAVLSEARRHAGG